MSDLQRLPTIEHGTGKTASGGRGVQADSAEASIRAYAHQHVDETAEKSSSDSSVRSTPEAPSTNDEEDTSSARSGETTSSGQGESSEGEELIQNLPLPKKPPISALSDASRLHARLSSFLPELQKANTELECPAESLSRRVDDVGDDEKHYIEMSLGLGVLKEKRTSEAQAGGVTLAHGYSTSSSEDSRSDSTETQEEMGQQGLEGTPLMDLMGSKQPSMKRPHIREVLEG